ncbi:hypothetical protein BDV38DRAFT_20324 [Aspergillus pseudotamarii]|uniref:Uncharacterized protein n=1 Tax=Aspergillus pseudotamarii TaxID=132259 RepID=A0A5N6T2Z1_ASPPS|nr:uncharacterized protein BDV38DRAFT_20324 [Aspergillus pseudotamarii]KAE8140639.1 hypothetical protein BDV38DRAFT_20324 [Aspergillus pseudotamarii]
MALHRSGSYLSFPVLHCSVFFIRHVPSPSVPHYHLLFFSSPTFLYILTTFLSNMFSLLPRTVSLPYHFLLHPELRSRRILDEIKRTIVAIHT